MSPEPTNASMAYVPTSRTIGRRIAELRQAKGLSQAHVAQRLELSRAAITQWEGGVTYPSLELIESLAVILGTTPWYLAFGHGAEVNSVSVIQVPWVAFNADGEGTETAVVGIPRPVISGWRINDVRQLVAVEINDNATEGLPSDLAIVDRSNVQTGFNVKVALLFGDKVQVANLSHTPGDDSYRISVSGDTFSMQIDKVKIIGRVVGKIARA